MSFMKIASKRIKTPIVLTEPVIKEATGPTMGIYYIKNIKDNKYYIGSSSNVERRLKTHRQHLEKGCHNSRSLQKDFDNLGEDCFKFDILEIVNNEELLTAYEKYYIYKTNAIVMYKGYNEKFPTSNYKLFKQVYLEKENRGERQ